MKCAVSRGAAAFELVTASQELNSYMSGAMARLCLYCSYMYSSYTHIQLYKCINMPLSNNILNL